MNPGDFVRILPPFDSLLPDTYQVVAIDGETLRLTCGDFAEQYCTFSHTGTLPGGNILTRLQFRNRFTQAEKVAIYTAAEQVVAIKVWLDDLMVAESVDLTAPETIAGVQGLEQAGLLAAGRADEILGV
jgi:hypothetical protein